MYYYDYVIMPETELLHFGVKGMKWGHRKKRNLTPDEIYQRNKRRTYLKLGAKTALGIGALYGGAYLLDKKFSDKYWDERGKAGRNQFAAHNEYFTKFGTKAGVDGFRKHMGAAARHAQAANRTNRLRKKVALGYSLASVPAMAYMAKRFGKSAVREQLKTEREYKNATGRYYRDAHGLTVKSRNQRKKKR